jgi:hypothetical protein
MYFLFPLWVIAAHSYESRETTILAPSTIHPRYGWIQKTSYNNYSVLFITNDQGSGRIRADEISRVWPYRSHVIHCADIPDHQEYYDIAVHVKQRCEHAFEAQTDGMIGFNVWDVVDDYDKQDLWYATWDGYITGTKRMTEDFCNPLRRVCGLIPHMSNLMCPIHSTNRLKFHPKMRIGIMGTAGVIDPAVFKLLESVGYEIVIERNQCNKVLTWLSNYVDIGDSFLSCKMPAKCDAFWDGIDVAIMWVKEGRKSHPLHYKPCTRLNAAAAMNIPVLAYRGYSCVKDAFKNVENPDWFVVDDYDLLHKLQYLPLVSHTKEYQDDLGRIRMASSASKTIEAYISFFNKLTTATR